MITLMNETNIKQFKIYLTLIKELKKKISSSEKVLELMCSFEEELCQINEQLENNHNEILSTLYHISLRDFMNSFLTDKREMIGSEILFSARKTPFYIQPPIIKELMKESTFDIEKIDELIALADKLIELNIKKATFSGDVDFDLVKKFSKGHSGYTTYVPKDLNFNETDEEGKVFISKVFSNSPYFYEEANDITWSRNKHYKINYTEEANWIICGEVGYYLKEKEIYTGISSPHTEFNYSASTLYPDLSTFPTKQEIFSLEHPKTLSLYLKNKNNSSY